MQQIVLVEDDQRLASLVKAFLIDNGFQVICFSEGKQALQAILSDPPALILLDINLPDSDGFTLCRNIRRHLNTPILFLTARDSDGDQINGLDLGGDDYLVKPVEPKVLLARVHSVLRRCRPGLEKSERLTFGRLSIDKNSRLVEYDNQPIDLTSHEFELLCLLASHPGQVQTREFVHLKMIGREYDGLDRSVDVRISRLRKKLFDDLKKPYRIITVWGKGYLFSPTAWE
ncbi:response regulator transcription factor [Gayadomonas joobiniege]|uniref:response regulator transcription factor n=1 Tax=Gayadomonas joobiniege TaxID=1234606 RepID=UPI00036BAEC9|nr:response regulator transcription factor [Gayadomonas joobiniege]